MKILALEFSTDQRGVAIVVDGIVLAQAQEVATRASHSFELIERVLHEAELAREQIESIAVGLGPGSYTGIRSAIALAQGWQLAKAIRLLGISSMECLVAEAQSLGYLGCVNFVIDAQRNELYFARYEIQPNSYREIQPLKLATLDEVRQHLQSNEIVAGPEVTKWFPDGKVLFPTATILGQLAATRQDFIAGENLVPIYLRETNFLKAPPLRKLPG